jgi:hypothetical protein
MKPGLSIPEKFLGVKGKIQYIEEGRNTRPKILLLFKVELCAHSLRPDSMQKTAPESVRKKEVAVQSLLSAESYRRNRIL